MKHRFVHVLVGAMAVAVLVACNPVDLPNANPPADAIHHFCYSGPEGVLAMSATSDHVSAHASPDSGSGQWSAAADVGAYPVLFIDGEGQPFPVHHGAKFYVIHNAPARVAVVTSSGTLTSGDLKVAVSDPCPESS